MEIFVAEFLDCTKGQANFKGSFVSEADLSELLWLDLASRFALALPIPYVQAAILNLLNPYIRSATVLRDRTTSRYAPILRYSNDFAHFAAMNITFNVYTFMNHM